MHESLSGREKEVLAAYSSAWREGHNEGFSNGWEDGYEAGKHAFRQRLLDCFGDNDELPPQIEGLLRSPV